MTWEVCSILLYVKEWLHYTLFLINKAFLKASLNMFTKIQSYFMSKICLAKYKMCQYFFLNKLPHSPIWNFKQSVLALYYYKNLYVCGKEKTYNFLIVSKYVFLFFSIRLSLVYVNNLNNFSLYMLKVMLIKKKRVYSMWKKSEAAGKSTNIRVVLISEISISLLFRNAQGQDWNLDLLPWIEDSFDLIIKFL